MFTSQRHVDSDEAVVGMMAKHIIERGERPIYFYGQNYGGGGALEAYLAAIPFSAFGVSSISFKLVPLAIYLGLIVTVFAFCLAHCGPRVAVLAGALVAFAVPGIEAGLKARGGHIESALFSILLAHFLLRILERDRPAGHHVVLFGFFAGMAVWCYEAAVVFLAACAVLTFCRKKLFFFTRWFAVFLAAFLVGWGPALYYNLTHRFDNLAWIASLGPGDGEELTIGIWFRLRETFSQYLPRFFVAHNFDELIPEIPAHAWIQYGVFAAAVCYLGVRNRRLIGRLARALIPGARLSLRLEGPGAPEAVLLLYAAMMLVGYASSGKAGFTARYFLPLLPTVFVLVAAAAIEAWDRSRTLGRTLVLAIVSFMLALGPAANIFAMGESRIVTSVVIARGQLRNRYLAGDTVPTLERFLEAQNVKYVVTSSGIQWPLIFESGEKIVASSLYVVPGQVRYPAYDEAVWRNPDSAAWVFHASSIMRQRLENILERENIAHERAEIGSLYIYYRPALGWRSAWQVGILMGKAGVAGGSQPETR